MRDRRDNYREKDQSLEQFKLYGFADKMFRHCPLLQPLHSELPVLLLIFLSSKMHDSGLSFDLFRARTAR